MVAVSKFLPLTGISRPSFSAEETFDLAFVLGRHAELNIAVDDKML
jgi:hypothetical protein